MHFNTNFLCIFSFDRRMTSMGTPQANFQIKIIDFTTAKSDGAIIEIVLIKQE